MSRLEDRKLAKEGRHVEAASRQSAVMAVTPGVVASLDLGASKIGCFIMKPDGVRSADHSIRVAGVGFVQSRGVRAGNIIDMEAAATAIAQAVERAEAMANVSVQGVRVSVPGAQTASHR
ncbi:MAG: cell division protein FtsA, partial [Asticcacaulis sp.]|nr:cell division protein FtsA [Asticcacaulis sp.]